MSSQQYIKFITEQITAFLNMSSEEKEKRKRLKKANRFNSISNHWLGLFPFAIKVMFKKIT